MAANNSNNNNNNNINNIYKSVRCRKSLLLTKALLHWFMLLTAAVLLLSPDFIVALKDVAVSIPQAVKRGSNALLVCNYDMENDTLYSVKWYKGRREFYRYTPKENPAMKVFGFTTGLNVERNLSNQSHVVLSAVPLNVSGKFTCEISVEAPSFTTAMVSGEMEVVELPEQQASVTGIQPRYRIGDLVDGNCSIKYSKPAANLTWTINGIVVPPHHIKTYQIEKYEEHNLESVVSAINFMVTTQHFIKGQMKLKCTATIFNIYTEEIENIIEEDRPRIMASGRSYDMNAYPYDQHASGDGFEDHNESYLTYYSAADVTSAATPSTRSSYIKLNKMFRLYLTKFVTAAKEAFLLTTSSSLLVTWPVTTIKHHFLDQKKQQKRQQHHQEQPHGQRQEISQQHPGSTVQATMLVASKFLLPATIPIHATPLTRPTSVQRDVKRSLRSISRRIQLQREIVNEMEINANLKDCKRSENIKTNDDENEDDNGDYFTEYDDDDDSRWRFGEEFMSSRLLIAHVDIIEWSIILSLNFALMLKYQKRGTQRQLQQYREEEAEPEEEKENYDSQQQQQDEIQFEQPAERKEQQLFQHALNSRSCQNKSPCILDPAWLCNDFLSSHQVYTLQHIKELKCFYNCQCDGDSDNDCESCSGCDTDSAFHDVEWQLCLSKQSYIDTFSKWHQKLLCPRQQRRVSSTMLLILTGGQKRFAREPCNQDRVASATMVTTDVGRMANLTKSTEGNQPISC